MSSSKQGNVSHHSASHSDSEATQDVKDESKFLEHSDSCIPESTGKKADTSNDTTDIGMHCNAKNGTAIIDKSDKLARESAHKDTSDSAHFATEGIIHPKRSGHCHVNASAEADLAILDYRKRFLICLFLTLPVLLLSPMFRSFVYFDSISHLSMSLGSVFDSVIGAKTFKNGITSFATTYSIRIDMAALTILSTGIFFYGGMPFFRGLVSELYVKSPGMMTLIALAISVAYIYSVAVTFGLRGEDFFGELVTLVDIMLAGHWIEMRAVIGAGKALTSLAQLLPSSAHRVMPDGSVVDVPLEQLKVGYLVLIKPGEKVPADGKVVSGETTVNESMVTGESMPVTKTTDLGVIGGSINNDGSIVVEITMIGKDSFLSKVIDLVHKAQDSKSKVQDLADRAAFWLTTIAVVVGISTFTAWILFSDQSLAFAVQRAVSVMVVTCPHALGLAIPLVIAVSTSIAARNGVLVRNRTAFENAHNTDIVIFDKTGTLTTGEFSVTDVVLFCDELTKEELLSYAASVEVHSEHLIAKVIVKNATHLWDAKDFKALPGHGVSGVVKGKHVSVVSESYLEPLLGDKRKKQSEPSIFSDNQTTHPQLKSHVEEGKTIVFVVIDGAIVGAVALADSIRPESRETIKQLQNVGIECVMLTGDSQAVASWIAKELELKTVMAEVLPQQKAEIVRDMQKKYAVVTMAGDGINDAPALAQADVAIAIGTGTDVAAETAHIILVRNNPLDIITIIKLAKATYTKMVQNLLWATGYNAIAIPLSAGVLYSTFGIALNPAIAAVFMSASTVICAINAGTLLHFKQ